MRGGAYVPGTRPARRVHRVRRHVRRRLRRRRVPASTCGTLRRARRRVGSGHHARRRATAHCVTSRPRASGCDSSNSSSSNTTKGRAWTPTVQEWPVHSDTSDDGAYAMARLCSHAREVGFQSVSALPMRLRTDVIGALNLFSTHARATRRRGPASRPGARRHRHDRHPPGACAARRRTSSRLSFRAALESRVVIEQAKGIVAERADVSIDAAFDLLRGYARNHNRLLSQTADEVIDGSPRRRRAQPTGGQVAVGEQGSSAPPWMMRSMNWRIASSAGMLSRPARSTKSVKSV